MVLIAAALVLTRQLSFCLLYQHLIITPVVALEARMILMMMMMTCTHIMIYTAAL